jgi:hypothetical protein
MTDDIDISDELRPEPSTFFKNYWYFAGCCATAALIGVSEMFGYGLPAADLAFVGGLGLAGIFVLGVMAE